MKLRGVEQRAVEAGGDQRPRQPGCSEGYDCRDGGGEPACRCAPECDACALFAAERQDHQRQQSDQQDRLHFVFQPDHAERGRRGKAERAGKMRAASDRDQDHQRKDHGAGGDELAAQDPRMHGNPAGQREGQRCEQRNAPIAKDQPAKACEDQHAADRDQEGEHAPGPHRMGHRHIERRGISRHRRQRPGIQEAEIVEQREPVFEREDGQIGGVIHELLRLAGIHGERAVDHHEIHIGVAPIGDEIAEQQE